MASNFLNFLAESGASFLHAKGKQATALLINEMAPQPNEKILEVGCGTGATLVEIAQNHSVTLIGVDLSTAMLRQARKRIDFCHLNEKIQLQNIEKNQPILVENESIDAIYIESVLAIQATETLRFLLKEFHRILKPNGRLLFNETIWLDSTTFDQAKSINSTCLQYFGIIQCNHEFLHLNDWMRLLETENFTVSKTIDIDKELASSAVLPSRISWQRSTLFDYFFKLKAQFSPALRRKNQHYEEKLQLLNTNTSSLMQGWLVLAHKKA